MFMQGLMKIQQLIVYVLLMSAQAAFGQSLEKLLDAVEQGNAEEVSRFLDQGLDANSTGPQGHTILMAASNSSGGVMGKLIDAQSIVVASVATGGHPDSPDAGTILRSVFWHSVALAALMGVLVTLQAYVWPGMVPTAP